MPESISSSLTTADIRTYIYPQDAAYVMDDQDDDVLYTLDLLAPLPAQGTQSHR